MDTRQLTLVELAALSATRGMLGAGIGLLLAGRLTAQQRNTAGWLLAGIGALSTIPLAITVGRRRLEHAPPPASEPATRTGARPRRPVVEKRTQH